MSLDFEAPYLHEHSNFNVLFNNGLYLKLYSVGNGWSTLEQDIVYWEEDIIDSYLHGYIVHLK